ncbi:MAG: ribosome silencing factor [Firmicutes bacterium]|nr:ribosome silencing factor [Candidatus Caballimonas caccae]
MESIEFAEKIINILSNHKAQDIMLMDVKDKSSVCDYYIVASGRSTTHTRSLCEDVDAEMDKEGFAPIRREGEREGRWIVMDYGDVLVHLFNDETRDFYNLEKVWDNGKNIKKY